MNSELRVVPQPVRDAATTSTDIRFSESTKHDALLRAGNRCECIACEAHGPKCNKELKADWCVQPVVPTWAGGSASVSNCEVLCPECYSRVTSMDVFLESLLSMKAAQLGIPPSALLKTFARRQVA